MLQGWKTTHALSTHIASRTQCVAHLVTGCLISWFHLELFIVAHIARAIVVNQDADATVVAPLTLIFFSLGLDEILKVSIAHAFFAVLLDPLGQLVSVTIHGLVRGSENFRETLSKESFVSREQDGWITSVSI